jgi:hypothetical protein
MATTREARYLFRVTDGRSELEKGAQDGTLVTLRRVSHPFIVAEHASECEGFKPPLDNGGFIFALRDHTSMEEAKDIANFLNRNLTDSKSARPSRSWCYEDFTSYLRKHTNTPNTHNRREVRSIEGYERRWKTPTLSGSPTVLSPASHT